MARRTSTVYEATVLRMSVLWSLELASEFYHDFFAYDFGGGGKLRLGFKPLSTRAKSQKARDARLERNLASRKGNLVTKDAHALE